MRKKRALLIASLLLPMLGAAAILIGLFAYHIGLDNNLAMGSGRKILASLGVCLILLRPGWNGFNWLSRRWGLPARWKSFNDRLESSRLAGRVNAIGQSRPAAFLKHHPWIWTASALLIVALLSVWYLTAGTFTRWTPYTRYFDRQADAFLAGQLALLDQPSPELAALDDLFNWRARQGIDYLWDVSYYNGQYYLYWGPAPALAAASIKLIHPGPVEDQTLVFLFISGLALSLGAVFSRLRNAYFPTAPGWTILLFTLTGVLCTPVFWLINRPSVYEAAIASAQLFIILALYGVLRGIDSQGLRKGWLAIAGAALGAAAASRPSYLFTILVISLVTVFVLLKENRARGWKPGPLLSFGLPLMIAMAGLAWFNYARFGSILETGLKYQLTGDALPVDRGLLFSPLYVLPNAYSSLFRPLDFTPGVFPFLFTPYIMDNMWPNFIHRPATYYSSEQVSGVFLTIPFLWLLAIPIIGWVRAGLDWIDEKPILRWPSAMPAWIVWMVAGAALTQLITSLFFVMTTMRYLADFAPLLILSTALAVFYGYERLRNRPGPCRLLSTVTILLCIATIVMGLLTNMQGADKRFESNNPQLYGQMIEFFSHKP